MKRLIITLSLMLMLLAVPFFAVAQMPITLPFYIRIADLVDVLRIAATDNYVLTYDASTRLWGPEATQGVLTDELVGVDAVSTAGYFGVAYNDGIFRFTQNHFTMADGGDYVTLSLADHNTARTALGLAIGSDVVAWDADLDTYAGITPSANIQTYLGAANYAAMRTQLGLVISTNVQAYDADLTTWGGITPSANVQSFNSAANYGAMRTALGVAIGSDVAAYSHAMSTHSDEDSYAISTSGGATLSGTIATALNITATSSNAQISINGSGILANGEQAFLIAAPSETVATNGIWITLGSNVTSGDLSGIRSRVTGNAGSSGANVRGVYAEAKAGASGYAAMLEGGLFHADYSAGTVTVSGDIRGLATHISQGTGLNAANLYGNYIHIQTRGNETITTDDFGLMILNEGVGGNGRQMDAGFYLRATNVSTPSAFGYGLDLSGAVGEIATADIRLNNGETISNVSDGTIEHTGFVGGDVYANGSKSGAFTIDWRNGNIQTVTITGALLDITFTEPGTGGKCELWITQGDGDDTLDWTHEVNPEWPGGVAPTLSTGAADVDVITFTFIGGTTYRGIFNGDFQ